MISTGLFACGLSAGSTALAGTGGNTALDLRSTSYLRESADRLTNGASIRIKSDWERSGKYFDAAVKVQGRAFLHDSRSFTPEASDLFVATSPNLSHLHSITLGRRTLSWSVADDAWSLGTWSPRFNWDPLHPETVGLTGATYQYQSRLVRLRIFGSLLAIPERGSPLHSENGKLVYSNPDAAVPYESVSVMNQQVPIRYTIHMPALDQLLYHGSLLAQLGFGESGRGAWASITAGFKPMNAADITADAALKLSPDQYVSADLYPRAVMHELATFEAGWSSERTKLWGSLTRELPRDHAAPAGRTGAPMGAATLGSMGADVAMGSRLRITGSALLISEEPSLDSGAAVQISIPGRYRFKRAARIAMNWRSHARLDYLASWTRDFASAGYHASIEARYAYSLVRPVTLGLGAEFFGEAPAASFYGPYYGNDRVMGTVSYAF